MYRLLLFALSTVIAASDDTESCESKSFAPIAEIQTTASAGFEYFQIRDTHFLIAANYFEHSKLYKIHLPSMTLEELWKIQTPGGHGVEHFKICFPDGIRHFFTIPNFLGKFSEVFEFDGERLGAVARIDTQGAVAAAAFFSRPGSCAPGHFRLALAEYSAHQITIFALHGGEANTLKPIQRLQWEGVAGLAAGWIAGDLHLVAASYHSERAGFAAESCAWLLADEFVQVQTFATVGAHDVELGVIHGQPVLFFSNDKGDNLNPEITSSLYYFDAASRRFVLSSGVSTHGAHAADFFECSGRSFLAVANFGSRERKIYSVESVVYEVSAELALSEFQRIPTHGATNFKFFSADGRCFLAASNEQSTELGTNVLSVLYELTQTGTTVE